MTQTRTRSSQSAFTFLEVMVAIVIVALGLLGAVGLQSAAHRAELDAYQRAQAMVLLRDMVDKIYANYAIANCFAFTANANGSPYLGTAGSGSLSGGLTCAGVGAVYALGNQALSEWNAALVGAGERIGGTNAGALINARGCISLTPDAATAMNVFTVAVAWQGSGPLFAITDPQNPPRPAVACGEGLYGSEDQRRVIWTTFRLANLKS